MKQQDRPSGPALLPGEGSNARPLKLGSIPLDGYRNGGIILVSASHLWLGKSVVSASFAMLRAGRYGNA